MSRSRFFVPSVVASVVAVGVVFYVAINHQAASPELSASSRSPTVAAAHTPGVVDSFSRSDELASLGKTDNGNAWTPIRGVWGIRSHEAYVSKSAGQDIAVIPMGSQDGTVQVNLAVVTGGCGLVFRYQDAANYLELLAVPKYATWVLNEVSGGKMTSLGNTGLSAVKNGTVVLVRLTGSTADVVIAGRSVRSFVVPDRQGAMAVGMIASGPTASATRWRGFVGTPEPPLTVTSTPSPTAGINPPPATSTTTNLR